MIAEREARCKNVSKACAVSRRCFLGSLPRNSNLQGSWVTTANRFEVQLLDPREWLSLLATRPEWKVLRRKAATVAKPMEEKLVRAYQKWLERKARVLNVATYGRLN